MFTELPIFLTGSLGYRVDEVSENNRTNEFQKKLKSIEFILGRSFSSNSLVIISVVSLWSWISFRSSDSRTFDGLCSKNDHGDL